MKKINSLLVGIGLLVAIVLMGSGTVSAQETMMKKAADTVVDTSKTVASKTVSGTKAVYKGGKRVGYTVGTKTWDGSKWVASNTWKGGKWVAKKTTSGTKWVYYKAKGTKKKVV